MNYGTFDVEVNFAQSQQQKKSKNADLVHECQEVGKDVKLCGVHRFTNQTFKSWFQILIDSNLKVLSRCQKSWLFSERFLKLGLELFEKNVIGLKQK